MGGNRLSRSRPVRVRPRRARGLSRGGGRGGVRSGADRPQAELPGAGQRRQLERRDPDGCFGPVTPGETGHPLAGQSTDVEFVNPASASPMRPGFTGHASELEAVLTWPSRTATLPVVLGTFNDYLVKAPISTSLNLPCGGSGTVTFVPVNGGPTAVPWRETVSFVGQP